MLTFAGRKGVRGAEAPPFRRIREKLRRGTWAAFGGLRRILGGVFASLEDPGFILPRPSPSGTIRLLGVLGRRRRFEGALAVDLGRLAQAAYREGLRPQARRFARGAFHHWCQARRAGELLRLRAEDALRRASL